MSAISREELKQRWPVLQAFLDGKKVEMRSNLPGYVSNWEDVNDPREILTVDLEVRVKPPAPREFWYTCGNVYGTEEKAKIRAAFMGHDSEIIHLVEKIDT